MAVGLSRSSFNDLALVGGVEQGVRFAFTERTGGVSLPPFLSLNLGTHVGDDPVAVEENRRRVLLALGCDEDACARLLVPNQVHGSEVALVESASPEALAAARACIAEGADAIVCTAAHVPVALCFADCVPVVLTAPGGFAVVHSGWKGTVARIAARAARVLMGATGAAPAQLSAYIGPHILGVEYEVSPELMERFAAEFACVRPAHERGSRLLDLSACIVEALGEVGVPRGNVVDPGLSTVRENDRFFSYRAEGGTCGRHAAVAVLTEA